MNPPFYTYGSPDLCAWQVENLGNDNRIFWLQTTNKRFARKLNKRHDTRRVEVVGYNHFRRIYEMRGSWRKVKRLIDRYFLSVGDNISPVNRLQNASQLGLVTADSVSTRSEMSAHTSLLCNDRSAIGVLSDDLAPAFVGQLRRQNPPVFATRGDLLSESKSQDRVRS
jgi:hypothetical protein